MNSIVLNFITLNGTNSLGRIREIKAGSLEQDENIIFFPIETDFILKLIS